MVNDVWMHRAGWAIILGWLWCWCETRSAHGDDQMQGWYQSLIWKRLNEQWSVGNYAEARLNDGVDTLHTWIASPRLRYDVGPRFHMQMNTTWFEALNGPQTAAIRAFRLELEANPSLPLGEDFMFSMRNRYEWRWRSDPNAYDTRIRIRPQLDWVMARDGLFRGLYANNEFFYDFDQNRFSENRLTPLGATFRPSREVELRIFYLWRRTASGTRWFTYHALGVQSAISF